MDASFNDDHVFLLLQFLKERNYTNTLHCLESESALFFDTSYANSLIRSGLWTELEDYIKGFSTALDDAFKDFIPEIKKQKLYEAFVNNQPHKALLIIQKEMMNGLEYDTPVLTQLLLTDKPGEHDYFANCVGIDRSRARMCSTLDDIIKKHPSLHQKCRFPDVDPSRLRILCNQSLDLQHSRCTNPKSAIDFDTMLRDHTCSPQVPQEAPIAQTPIPLNMDGITKVVVARARFDSTVTAFDFHSKNDDLCAIGTKDGGIFFFYISKDNKTPTRDFEQWNRIPYSSDFQRNTEAVSVTSIKWSPDGRVLGVGYSKHLVHVYEVKVNKFQALTEIEAHPGHVSDLEFLTVDSRLLLVTCGNEGAVKIWDARSGGIQHTLNHSGAVCSISVRQIAQRKIIYAVDSVGVILAWKLTDPIKKITYDEGFMAKKIAFSNDGSRIFTSGYHHSEKASLREWTDADNHLNFHRKYYELEGKSGRELSFDRFGRLLAAICDDSLIFWVIGQTDPVFVVKIRLPNSLDFFVHRYSKNGAYLALSASDNTIHIYGDHRGLKHVDQKRLEACKAASSANLPKKMHDHSSPSVLEDRSVAQKQSGDAVVALARMERHLSMPSQIRSLKLSVDSPILRLVYVKSGHSLLALTSNAANKIWRWEFGMATTTSEPRRLDEKVIRNETMTPENHCNRVVACLAISKDTMHVLSASGEKISVLYILNEMRLRTSFTFPPPAVAVACLSYDPRSTSVVCAGMVDGSLLIYDVVACEVLKQFSGHGKCVTGLAYIISGKVLASSGEDDQLCLWDLDTWEKKSSKTIFRQPPDKSAAALVQSNPGGTCLLVINGRYVATYDPFKLDCINEWETPEPMGSISGAVYSCDGKCIYVLMADGSVCVLGADKLNLEARIKNTAYMGSNSSSPAAAAAAAAIAANPSNANQIALGLYDGRVYLLEPLSSETQWGYDGAANR